MSALSRLFDTSKLSGGLFFLPVFALLGGLFLPLPTTLFAEKAALYHSASKLSLNTWYFYFFKDPFFLDLHFGIFAPTAPLFSAAAWLLSGPVVIFLLGALLAYLFVSHPLPNASSLLRTLALIFPFFYSGYAEFLTLWILLWAAWIIFADQAPQDPNRKMWLLAGFSGIATVVHPGLWPLFWILWGLTAAREIGYGRFILALIFSLLPVILWSLATSSTPPSQMLHHLALPVSAWLQKYTASGESYLISVPENLQRHVFFYSFHVLALVANFYVIFRDDRKSFLKMALMVSGLLVFSVLVTRGESLYVLSAAVAISLFYPRQEKQPKQLSPWLWAWIIPALVAALLLTPEGGRCQKESARSTWIVSLEDLSALDVCPEDLGGVVLLDTKIIPGNVKTLTEEPLAHDDEPIIGPAGVDFLAREREYAASVVSEWRGRPFHILIRTRIHPAREEAPFRRIHSIWSELMQDPEMDRRLVLR